MVNLPGPPRHDNGRGTSHAAREPRTSYSTVLHRDEPEAARTRRHAEAEVVVTRQSIRRGTFASVTVLITKIRDYTDDRIERAREVYERAVFGGDTSALIDAEQGLDAVEADAALAPGLILHARFQSAPADAGSLPAEDPAELPLFERALELYRALWDPRGEAEALFLDRLSPPVHPA
jgi:hypothetical protein